MLTLRTGVDLVEIERLEQVNPRIRERFIRRVYTPRELAEIEAGDFQALAGHFAAKEAVSKALGTGIGRVHWQDIEVTSGPWGEPVLSLYGLAKTVAERLGLTAWSVSITDSDSHAIAVAVAVGM